MVYELSFRGLQKCNTQAYMYIVHVLGMEEGLKLDEDFGLK